MSIQTRKIIVRGIVQGVGFRPFIHRLAHQYGLKGTVGNNSLGVEIEAEGDQSIIQSFIQSIKHSPPPLALIDTLETYDIPYRGFEDFVIRPTNGSDERFTLISPDVTVCSECLKELFDTNDRRYRYPFINCTNCGPRFTIIQDIPYDRRHTTMSVFPMCADCDREFHDPGNRRFHAQPNACPECGPRVSLMTNKNHPVDNGDAIRQTAELLLAGKIIAIKGLGGYHLACDASNERAVELLRERKRRIEKPFAVMIPDIEWLERVCSPSQEEISFIRSINHPIVLIQKSENSPVCTNVAPGNNYIGVMLPYTPLHEILLRDAGIPLVMTSGNISEEPIAYKDSDAFSRLDEIADYFLIHDRDIHMRCDDSVGAVLNNRQTMLRRSRGYVPYPVKLNLHTDKPILAAGGHLKNTFCLLKNDFAFISHHIGDLENYETLDSFMRGIEHFKNIFHVSPEILAYDMHPEYLSTKYAVTSDIAQKIPVQHHHAHIVSCMADNNITDEVIGVSFDGTGYGTDGTIWGGEFMTASLSEFNRFAHLAHIPLPGGEQAIKEPWRTGLGLLRETFGNDYISLEIPFIRSIADKYSTIVEKMIDRRLNTPVTSAAGRLFDGVAAVCNVRDVINYEAQAAIEFQMLADKNETGYYDYEIDSTAIPWKIHWYGIIKNITEDIIRDTHLSVISGKFHNTLAAIIADIAARIKNETGFKKVVLSGGVFQNALLLEKSVEFISRTGLQVFTHSRVPPNDGGLSLGQAVIAMNKHSF